jgi:DNA polymerase-1
MAPSRNPRTLYLVDGTSQLFRAFFALPALSNAQGLPTNAVYGFTSMLRKLVQDEQPPYLAVVFDPPGAVFRHDAYTDYKAHREPPPDDLARQVPYAKLVCEVLGIEVLQVAGYEADDVIATVARRARAAGFEVVVVASDKDLLQLVGDGIRVLNPVRQEHLDAAGVTASFGVPPERVRDVLGLMGDSVDNIPGVPGVGQKTALQLVATYGDVEAVLERAARFAAAYDAREALLAALERAAGATALDEAAARELCAAGAELDARLRSLRERETEPGFGGRIDAALAELAAACAPALAVTGQSGRSLARALGPLRRELRGLDRASGKRIWYALRDHADEARLSRRLATLDDAVPVEFVPDRLARRAPDRARAQELFDTLGLRAVSVELAAPGAVTAAAAGIAAAAAEVVVVADRASLRDAIAECRAAQRFALAVEIEGPEARRGRVAGIALAARPGRGLYVPFELGGLREELGPLLADPERSKVVHDLKGAAHALGASGLAVAGWALDTEVAAFLLDSGRSNYALASLAQDHLGAAPAGPPAALEADDVPSRAARRAETVLRLADVLETQLAAAGLLDLYRDVDGALLPLLGRMEARGIRIDVDQLAAMSGEMQASLDELRSEIHALAGGAFNVDSPKQLREVLFDRLGLRSRRRTAKSGEASTDAQALEELAAEHPIVRKILDYRELSKLKGTYVEALPRLVDPATGRVHTTFHPTGAATGRLSSSDPNLQNIPVRTAAGRRIRAAFVPAEGFVFLSSDYSQIELRLLAHLSGDPDLIAAFRAGEDIHRHTAARVFGVAPGAVLPAMRRRAKAINFGILYGMSETRLAREQGMSRTEARRFIQAYFDRFGEVRRYLSEVREQARQEGAVRTLLGRVRYFPVLHQRANRAVLEAALRAAVNMTLQGTAADLIKIAMLRVDEALRDAGADAAILLQVHDELLLEVREERVEAIAPRVRRAMEGVRQLEVPLVVDQKVGRSWLEVT